VTSTLTAALLTVWAATAGLQGESEVTEVPPAERLDLVCSVGSVGITAWDEPRVEVRSERSPGIRVEVKRSPEVVEVRVHRETRQAAVPVALEIRLPPGMGVLLSGEACPVKVTGIRGDIELSAELGDLELTDVAGRVDLASTAGGIMVQGLEGRLSAETVRGDIRVERARPDFLRLTSDHGALTYRGSLVPGGHYDLATQTGTVDFVVSGETGARYEVGTFRGRLRSNLAFPEPLRPGERVVHEEGDAEAVVEIMTFGGEIRIFTRP